MRKSCLVVLALACCLAGMSRAATFAENFATNPLQNGWKIFGESSLFQWNSTNQNLEVTWCSTNGNNYFYRPLGTVLGKVEDFGFSFDLRLKDVAIGIHPEKSDTFQIAVGLINIRGAAHSNYVRGNFGGPTNLVECLYYPNSGWGATISSTAIDKTGTNWAYGYMYQELTPNDLYHIELNYAASNQTLYTTVLRNGQPLDTSSASLLDPDFSGFTDFRVDAFSISSYSDEGQIPGNYDGSVLAHGTMDNVVITSPGALVIPLLASHAREVQFASRTNWFYRLEGTSSFTNWSEVASGFGNGGVLSLSDTNAHPARFYRIAAERP